MKYLLGALGSLIKRDSAIFEKKSLKMLHLFFLSTVNVLLLSMALTFEISIFFQHAEEF